MWIKVIDVALCSYLFMTIIYQPHNPQSHYQTGARASSIFKVYTFFSCLLFTILFSQKFMFMLILEKSSFI